MKYTADRPGPATTDRGWRIALALGGVALLAGGGNHPSGPTDASLRVELATMMEDDAWYPSHTLMLIGAILLAVGIRGALQRTAWRPHQRQTRFLALAMTAFAVESFFHVIAAVDATRLRDGDFAPIAFIHIGLAILVYPATGLALAWLGWGLARTWPVPARVVAVAVIGGGVMMALSVPLAVLTDVNTDIFFMLGGLLPAIWAIVAGLVGARSMAPATLGDQGAMHPEAVSA